MGYKITSIFSLGLTVITCFVVIMTFGGCTTEQLEQTADVFHTIENIAPVVAPLVPVIGWPVWSLLGVDIASSILAAIVAFRKQQSTATQ